MKLMGNVEMVTHYPSSSGIFWPFFDGCGPVPARKCVRTPWPVKLNSGMRMVFESRISRGSLSTP